VKHALFPAALGVLLTSCVSLLGQEAQSASDPTSVVKPSTAQSESEQGMYVSGFYVSGFEDLKRGWKNEKDLGDYPIQVLARVRGKWYPQIPRLQKSAARKRGTTVVDFEIKRDGSLGKMTNVSPAGDTSLDAAATVAISSSGPFARLPEAYQEKALNLRMSFGYDQPLSKDAPFCDGPNWGAHQTAYVFRELGNNVTPPQATYNPDPEYSEEARRDKYMSLVQVAGTVDSQGSFTDICLTQAAGEGLDEKAFKAVRTWKFEPATREGQPILVRLLVEVSFRLY
jgi:TonB family protein